MASLRLFYNCFILTSIICFTPSFWNFAEAIPLDQITTCLEAAGVNASAIIGRSNNEGYSKLNHQWQTCCGRKSPGAYFLPESSSQIQAAVICCNQFQTRIVPRSGGHGYAKYGFGDENSLVVDLRRLNQVVVNWNSSTAVIGSGAILGEVWYETFLANVLVPIGICPTVGIAGNALGGGYGYFARLYGLVSDNILEMKMIDAVGNIRTINNESNTDLFWALRGAGGGSFGIVTTFTFKTYPSPENVVVCKLDFYWASFPAVFESWQVLFSSNPSRYLSSYLNMGDLPNIYVFLVDLQNDLNYMHQVVATFPNSTQSSIRSISYSNFLVEFATDLGFTPKIRPNMNFTSPADLPHANFTNGSQYSKSHSMFVEKVVARPDTLQLYFLINELINSLGIQAVKMFVVPNGGRINEIDVSESAFVHRGAVLYNFVVEYYKDDDAETVCLKEEIEFRSFIKAAQLLFSSKESYQNYVDGDEQNYLDRYYGGNLKRLVEIKNTVDPNNVFHHPQSIPLKL